jgi:hypothetical protein
MATLLQTAERTRERAAATRLRTQRYVQEMSQLATKLGFDAGRVLSILEESRSAAAIAQDIMDVETRMNIDEEL